MYSKELKLWTDEKLLLEKIASGDQGAFRVLYDRYRKKMYTFSLKILKSELLAEEIVQESFLKLWQLQDGLKEINHLETYLRTLARNKALNTLRRIKLEVNTVQAQAVDWQESHNETEEQLLLEDTRKVLRAAVELLPPQQKLVYQLCHLEGLKYEEVAERLNISRLTVQKHMKLALRFLRSYVSKHTDLGIILILLKLL